MHRFSLNVPILLYSVSKTFSLIAGGVLEKNEIFNNRFDGVSLATGVLPKMIGE